MNEGVEWAAHCCILLDWLGAETPLADRAPVPAARLAAAFEVPPAYLNKQLQALARAGLLRSVAGARGGFRLARPLARITLMDVVAAVEGPDDAFACTEIRRRGAGARPRPAGEPDPAPDSPGAAAPPRASGRPCGVAAAMRGAELAWRRALAGTSLADLRDGAERESPDVGARMRRWYDRGDRPGG